jgi:hypothetical protein
VDIGVPTSSLKKVLILGIAFSPAIILKAMLSGLDSLPCRSKAKGPTEAE